MEIDGAGVPSSTDRHLLDDCGFQLWQRLRTELAGAYQVHFFSHEFNETFEDPEQFKVMTRNYNAEPHACPATPTGNSGVIKGPPSVR